MHPTNIFSAMTVLAGALLTGAAAAQNINLNMNRPTTIQQLQLPNLQNQQRRENFQLQQQYYRDVDRSNTANGRNAPNVPIIVPNCRPTISGSPGSQSCR